MDAPTPKPTATPDDQKQSLDQDSGARLPSPDDPDIDEHSSVTEIIAFGKHSSHMGGKGSRIEWEWRRRRFKTLHYLRAQGLRGGAFADAAQNAGMSRSEAFKVGHFWSEIDAIDSFVAHRCKQSVLRRGVQEYPSNNELLTEFPKPGKKSSASKGERDEDEEEEAEARTRAKANANATVAETMDPDTLAKQVAKLTRDIAIVIGEREDAERKLADEREVTKALHVRLEAAEQAPVPVKPVLSPEVPAPLSDLFDDALCDLYDVVVLAADPVVTPDVVTPDVVTPDITPDATKIILSSDAVTADERDDIERHYKLPANWAGAKATTEAAAHRIVAYRNVRAHFYAVWGANLTPDEHAAARKVGKDKTVWEAGTLVASVLAKIVALMATPDATPTPATPKGE